MGTILTDHEQREMRALAVASMSDIINLFTDNVAPLVDRPDLASHFEYYLKAVVEQVRTVQGGPSVFKVPFVGAES